MGIEIIDLNDIDELEKIEDEIENEALEGAQEETSEENAEETQEETSEETQEESSEEAQEESSEEAQEERSEGTQEESSEGTQEETQEEPAAPALKLADFCNMTEFERILTNWSFVNDMAAIARDTERHVISRKHGFTKYCEYILSSAEGRKACEACERKADISCCHAGLCDFSVPVTLPDGQIIAYISCGQTRLAYSDTPDFFKYAEDYDLDTDKILEHFGKTVMKTEEQIEAAKALLSAAVNNFVAKSYLQWKSQGEASEGNTIPEALKSLYAYNLTLDLKTGEYTMITGTGLDRVVAIYKSNNDYPTALKEIEKYIRPDHVENILSLLSRGNLMKKSDVDGFVGKVEIPIVYPDVDECEWIESIVFMSKNSQGNSVVSILGRDVTDEHKRVEQIEVTQKAVNSAVKNFVEIMGGTVEIKSESGKGTIFTANLPQEIVDESAEDETVDGEEN